MEIVQNVALGFLVILIMLTAFSIVVSGRVNKAKLVFSLISIIIVGIVVMYVDKLATLLMSLSTELQIAVSIPVIVILFLILMGTLYMDSDRRY